MDARREAETATSYTFGDTPLAAERLRLVARVFEDSSHAFLRDAVPSPPAIALDLGCGPGLSTVLVARTTGARRTIGIDASPAFLERARADAPGGVEFVAHDVTRLPLPSAPADLVYCRLLLAHLADPAAQVAAWATQLTPGGRLLVDEVEWIETAHPVLATYEELVVDLVASRGGVSYAGPMLDALAGGDGWTRRSSELRTFPVATADAAQMYGMNLTTWRHDPYVAERHAPETIDRLAADLTALASGPRTSELTWGIRQAVFERAL